MAKPRIMTVPMTKATDAGVGMALHLELERIVMIESAITFVFRMKVRCKRLKISMNDECGKVQAPGELSTNLQFLHGPGL